MTNATSLGMPGSQSSDAAWSEALKQSQPEFSAATPLLNWQRRLLVSIAFALAAGMAVHPEATASVGMALLTPAFTCIALLRAMALWDALITHRGEPALDTSDAGDLPTYSILIPLYREAHMASSLVAAVDRLDWPAEKRDVLFITEAHDIPTRVALENEIRGRAGMRVLVVPTGTPRTKPRALTYALPIATGTYIVVYDAEDEPEPDQLRKAYQRFTTSEPIVACLQAKLNIYNARTNWLTRQFALEYTALFDAILPSLQRHGLPVPLGGTSNHFRRNALEQSGGWDPYNVTEDADLGIRLARLGWRVEVLDSTTWEEAPPHTRTWMGQRSRWLKGWIQTSLVHLRDPRRLWSQLGPRGFIGFNVLMGGVILSALMHPLVYTYALWKLAAGEAALWPPAGWQALVWWAGVANLALGYIVGIALAVVSGWRRHGANMAAHALLIPFYWLMISLAAYSAVFEFFRAPFRWRKTAHTGRSRRATATDTAE